MKIDCAGYMIFFSPFSGASTGLFFITDFGLISRNRIKTAAWDEGRKGKEEKSCSIN